MNKALLETLQKELQIAWIQFKAETLEEEYE